jgi:hypothetical protein
MSVGKLLTALIATPVLMVVAVIGGCEARKAYFDRQVDKLCESDGGVTVFETVAVSKQEYLRLGGSNWQVPVPEERSAPPDYPYVSNTTRTVLRNGHPEVTRTEALVKRRSDGKVLARLVTYTRIGGDPPSWAHPSHRTCNLPEGNLTQVFIVEGAAN